MNILVTATIGELVDRGVWESFCVTRFGFIPPDRMPRGSKMVMGIEMARSLGLIEGQMVIIPPADTPIHGPASSPRNDTTT